MSTVLCIDDEPAILRLLSVVLAADGHEVMTATAGREALTIIGRGAVDAVLLDLGLADRDGLELIPAIRAITAVPILVISARGEVAEKVTALDLGAADYITKPFDGDEVRARLRVALRQGAKSLTPDGVICHGPIRMNPERHEAEVSGRPLSLTPKEYALLKALIEANGRVLTHAALLERVWGKAHRQDVEYLRVTIRALRLKIEEDPARPIVIRNEPGVGYRLG
ncbi:two component transcriptional regulator, winged helix family [Novosphingobium aromaticivorans DSM 12444]|uniref:Two component transcriptional regulator, winged helix family n=1 Tax=Novosphingobium aromaticivorans (strain ATCC 700278 / DSM 12444 / CCUG 56034 / CIP 105152 / NBRC 16084 / F199) TaxID=279238 RepID=Q2G872_NOVAD|nr:response regulator transcription factor [Novosphingobium aromaticivorans]ABD25951.1 two component transcriptional regulator, winged helix family [Novosphingobium aromaticivorans DSM 12444]SCY96921.1 two component transcriptional regulator, winged helix family [Novosphingobium aromaticivorans]